MSTVNYSEKIPNNVNLGEDRTLQRALEGWQPNTCGKKSLPSISFFRFQIPFHCCSVTASS